MHLASQSLKHALGAQKMKAESTRHILLLVSPSQDLTQQDQCKTHTSLTQIPGHIPWCKQIVGSCHPYPL